jgi:membrane protein DedA with SNARE-associated domain
LAHRDEVDIGLVMSMGLLWCLAGDLVWFEAGRDWGRQILRILSRLAATPHYCAQQAHKVFERWGLRSLIVAKFIPGLDGLTPPMAGLQGSSRQDFLVYDFVGSFLWTALYVGLGYSSAERLTIIAASMARFGTAIAAGIGIPIMCYLGWRVWIMIHMLRHLVKKDNSASARPTDRFGGTIAIIDLLDFDDDYEERAGIRGAVRMAPSRLRSQSRVVVSERLEMVFYSVPLKLPRLCLPRTWAQKWNRASSCKVLGQ